MQYICWDHRIYWGEDETADFPVKTVDHHPEYCVIGTESWLTQNDTPPVELTEAPYDYKQGKGILCCNRKKLRFSQISRENKQNTEWKTGSSHLPTAGSQ